MLDLRLQRQRHRTLPPIEQVRKPAVSDHDVREGVRRARDAGDRLLVGLLIEPHLQDADGLAATGHRGE